VDVDAEKLAEDLVLDLEALLAGSWSPAGELDLHPDALRAVPLEVWARRNGVGGASQG
jgi:hypothetical protein